MRVLMSMTIGLLLTEPAFAEDQSICPDAQTTIEIGECVSKEYDKADAELNAVWKKVMATFEKNDTMPAKDLKPGRRRSSLLSGTGSSSRNRTVTRSAMSGSAARGAPTPWSSVSSTTRPPGPRI